MRIVTNIFFMLIIFNLISCKKKVDCNGDLVYEDGLTYYKGELYTGNCESFFQNGITKRPHKIQELFEKGNK